MRRHIIHLHIPAFSIAVVRISQPELRDRPVAVAPLRTERAPILSASSEARKEGVFKGMPLSKAVKLCPGLKILRPNAETTEKAHRSLAGMVARYTPLWESSRPGHIYLDLTGTERLWGEAKDTAYRLRKEISGRLNLSGTAGVAGNKMVSNIASRITLSGGVLDVDHGREATFMAPLKVGLVPGIGRFRRKILLEELNIVRVRELAALDLGRLKLIFGRQALVVHQRALGIDLTPVYPSVGKPSVSEEMILPQDENDDERLMGFLFRLVEKCAHRLRSRGFFPRNAGLLIRYSDQDEVKRQITLPQSSFWDLDLYSPLETLLFKACHRRVRVRVMKVWFQNFSFENPQRSLFPGPPPAQEKRSRLMDALDRIRERHGEGAIRYGKAV